MILVSKSEVNMEGFELVKVIKYDDKDLYVYRCGSDSVVKGIVLTSPDLSTLPMIDILLEHVYELKTSGESNGQILMSDVNIGTLCETYIDYNVYLLYCVPSQEVKLPLLEELFYKIEASSMPTSATGLIHFVDVGIERDIMKNTIRAILMKQSDIWFDKRGVNSVNN